MARKPPPTSVALPGMSWSFDLPDRLKIAIANSTTIFSHIDHMVIECVWAIENADLARKKKIARDHAHGNIAFVRDILETHMHLDVSTLWDALDDIKADRNLIAHGVWSMRFGGEMPDGSPVPDDGMPMVLWHSKMLESDDFHTAEAFDYSRFDRFMGRARVLLRTFQQFASMAAETNERLAARRAATPKPPAA